MMRRILLTATAIAALGSIAVLVSCEFDNARAAAVLRSMPRTLGAAGGLPSFPAILTAENSVSLEMCLKFKNLRVLVDFQIVQETTSDAGRMC